MSRHPMPAADAAWLHMDRPTNPMVVNGLVMLGGPIDPDRAAELLEERLVGRFPRFSRRVVDPLGRSPAFEDDPSFDLRNHLHRLQLRPPGDEAALRELLGDLVTPPLDPGKPLWHAYLIEGFDGGAVILWRIHHCIADGIALARVMLSTTDDGGAAVSAPAERAPGLLRRVAGLPGGALSAARSAGSAVAHEGMEALAHPDHLRELAAGAGRDAATAAKLVASPSDPPSGLRVTLAGARRLAWSTPYPLQRVKEAGHRRRVTVNDLLVAALAGALRELPASGAALPEELHAMVPFNLRPLDEPVPAELGNDFALILLALPVGEMSPVERLRRVSSRMDEIKRSHEAPMSYGILSAIGLTPPWIEDRLIGFFTDKASLVATNVPGSAEQLRFGGVPIESVLFWAPCSGSIGMTVGIHSYHGEVTVGFMTDVALTEEPERLARAYERELEALCG